MVSVEAGASATITTHGSPSRPPFEKLDVYTPLTFTFWPSSLAASANALLAGIAGAPLGEAASGPPLPPQATRQDVTRAKATSRTGEIFM